MALFGCNRFSPYGMPSRFWNQGSFFGDIYDPWQRHLATPGPLRVFLLENLPEGNSHPKKVERPKERPAWSETFYIGDRFDPENVTIKTTDDTVTVTAKREHQHEDRLGKGHSFEQMTRTVHLPKDVNPKSVKAYVSEYGELKLIAQRNDALSCGEKSCLESSDTGNTEGDPEHMETASDKTEEKIAENMEEMDSTTTEAEKNAEAGEGEEAPKPTEMAQNEITEKEEEPWSVKLNLEGFQPENLTVKVQGNVVKLSAERTEEKDGFYSSQRLHKVFSLPENVNPDQLSSYLSESGILRLSAPVVQAVEYTPEERLLTVQHENLPTLEN